MDIEEDDLCGMSVEITLINRYYVITYVYINVYQHNSNINKLIHKLFSKANELANKEHININNDTI